MTRLFLVLLWALTMLVPARADEPWSGRWQITRPNGGAQLDLSQQGTEVRGAFSDGRGEIVAKASGSGIEGDLIHEGAHEEFSATLDPDLQSFSGWTSAGDWLTGKRIEGGGTAPVAAAPDLHSPRAAMRSFLAAGNRARDEGDPQALAEAVAATDFGSGTGTSYEAKFAATEDLFEAIDLATFSLSAVPEETDAQTVSLRLPRLDSAGTIDVGMARGPDGAWRLVMPPAERLRAMFADAAARPADAYRDLKSPRDALRSFLSGMANWQRGGEADAIATLDLSGTPDFIRAEQGRLVANYLVRIIDRVGHMPLQAVPNSGASREPFVYFAHPAGRIVIVPVGKGAETRWQFSAETVADARRLYAAVQSLPDSHALEPGLIPYSKVLALREFVKAHAPALLADVGGRGRVEYWQLIGALAMLAMMIVLSLVLGRIAAALLRRPSLKHQVANPSRLGLAAGVSLAIILGASLMPYIGLPTGTRQFTVPIFGSLLLLLAAYVVWNLIGIVSHLLEGYTERTETPIDNILLTFVRGVARLALVCAAGLGLGQLWSIPTTGIIAGLGIGGLAVAFASKETLANVFGAGILLGDRPFRKGDRIIVGDVNGWVEAVGLRSTRVRTLYDSLLIVPNGKLADTTINNLGARRRRTLTTVIPVTSGSTPGKLEAFTEAIAARVGADPMFERGTEVNIIAIGAEGIQVELSTSLNTRRGFEARAATHRLFLDILRMAEERGLTLGRGMEDRKVERWVLS